MRRTLIARSKARQIASISRPTEHRWLRNPSLNPLWPRPVPAMAPGGASPYVLEEIEAYVEARIAARDASQGPSLDDGGEK